MKKLVFALAAFAAALTPLAIATPAAAHGDSDGYHDDDRYEDRRGRHRDHYDDDRYEDRRDRYERRRDWRDSRREAYDHYWDNRRFNGYYYNQRFYYGPPPQAYYGHPSYRPHYRTWARGQYLPPYYRQRCTPIRDYHRFGLRHPPRGYHWVRDDRGDYILVGIATGLIMGLVLGGAY